jgi:hypothetical protein
VDFAGKRQFLLDLLESIIFDDDAYTATSLKGECKAGMGLGSASSTLSGLSGHGPAGTTG